MMRPKYIPSTYIFAILVIVALRLGVNPVACSILLIRNGLAERASAGCRMGYLNLNSQVTTDVP
jgi:hypothetical protein